jgi:beta-glucanase (GH16 family)
VTRLASLIVAALVVLVVGMGIPPSSEASDRPDCGKRLAGWRCTFADDFRGTQLNAAKWVAQRTDLSGYTSGQTACFMDGPSNISVSNGRLSLTAREETEPFTCEDPYGYFPTRYTSGMVTTAEGRFSQAYGRFEVRAKVSSAKVRGLHSAVWLYPASHKYGPWPDSGEIDVAELYSAYPDRAIPYIHYKAAEPDPTVTNNECLIGNSATFHTYAVEWTRSRIEVIYDGRNCLTHYFDPASPLVGSQPFDQPFIIALTQALGVATNEFDPETTPLPATTKVDYVRAWKFRSDG